MANVDLTGNGGADGSHCSKEGRCNVEGYALYAIGNESVVFGHHLIFEQGFRETV